MPTTSTPAWSGAQASTLGSAGATAASAQINQLLGTHASSIVYQGANILAPTGGGSHVFDQQMSTLDRDQPFTMVGTSIGRVTIPLLAVGSGADLLVSLCQDNSGSPGTVICQTRVPASWITQLSAVTAASGPSSSPSPVITLTGNPLAVAQFHSFLFGGSTFTAWPTPAASGGTGSAGNPESISSGNYYVQCGGTNSASAQVTDVHTIQYAGGVTLNYAAPQPAMPLANDNTSALVSTNNPAESANTIVIAGGTTSGSATANVFTASFNTATGVLGAWSSQTAVPQTLIDAGTAAWNDYVYLVGGYGPGGILNVVYYAQVQNGQITGWNTATLPESVINAYVAVSNGFLFVVAGSNGASNTTTAWYAPLNSSTGAPGPWVNAPALPATTSASVNGNAMSLNPYGLLLRGTNNFIYALPVTANGPGAWKQFQAAGFADDAAFPLGNGAWQWFEGNAGGYVSDTLSLVPQIPVPLPAAGLTNGGTYHVLFQQQGGNQANYLRTCVEYQSFPGYPAALQSARGTYSWSAPLASRSIPMWVYDGSAGGQPWHTWEDNGSHITTLVWATTPDRRILGVCEATRMGLALNANAGFQSGTSPWTATNCTLAQSTTQSYSGGTSGRITPNGVSTAVSIASERMACMPGQSISVSAWAWFTSAVSSTFSLSVVWYTAITGGATVSTSSALVSASATTWAEVSNTFAAPGTAYAFTLVPTLSGTPSAAQIVYVDDLVSTYTYTGPQQSSVTEFLWSGTWPNAAWPGAGFGAWPPLGSQVLA